MLVLICGLLLLTGWLELRDARQDLEARRDRIDRAWVALEDPLQSRMALAEELLEHARRASADNELHSASQGLSASLSVLRSANDRAAIVSANLGVDRALRRYVGTLQATTNRAHSEDMRRVEERILAIEHRIALQRSAYNEAVQRFNTRRAIFPANLAARIFGLKRYPHYLPTDLRPSIALPVDSPEESPTPTGRAARAGRP